MASTQDEILKILKDIDQNLQRGSKGGSGIGGSKSGVSYDGTVDNLIEQIGSFKTSNKKAAQANKLAANAKMMGNTKAAGKYGAAAASASQMAKGAKGGIAGAIAGIAADVAKKIGDFAVKMKEFEFKEKEINLEAAKKSLQVQTALYGSAATKSISVGINTVVGDLKDTVYQSMENAIDLGKQNFTANLELSQIKFEKETDLQINSMKKTAAAVGAAADTVSGVLGSIPNPYTVIAGALISIGNSIFQAKTEVEIMRLEYQKKQIEMLTDFKKDMMEQSGQLVQQFVQLSKGIDKLLMDLDNNSHIIGRSFGFATKQVDTYTKASAQLNIDMAEMGKTYEDLMKAQQAYILASDRNVLMNGEEGKQITALGKLFNMEEGEIGSMVGGLNLFNTSIESGSDIMFEMYKTANKMGVSNQKFAKDMQKNLKLAEKYQFKGGVKAMMDMALWAQKTRFNLDELAGALEKMHTGNVEDVLSTSARLNVLGGNAGVLSDPMSMLYNAYMDPTAYAKNINQMIQGFGSFNKKTGETEFNVNEQMRMEAMANALGISKENFMNQARQTKKEEQIRKKFGNKFGDKTSFVTQNATYDRNKGEWVANVFGKDENGETTVIQKSLNNLTDEDVKNIFPEDTQEQLVTYTKGIFSLLEKQKVVENTNRAEIAAATQDTHKEQTIQQQVMAVNHNKDYREQYVNEVKEGFLFQTDSFRESLNLSEKLLTTTKNGKTLSQNYYEMSIAGMSSIGNQIGVFQDALTAVITDDANALIEAMRVFNPEGAHEVSMALSTQYNTEANRDAWEKAIDMAQDTDLTNGLGQYNNDDFIKNGFGFFDKNGNFYLNLNQTTGFEDGEGISDMIANVEKGNKYRVDRTTGQVTRANDLIISPRNGVFELDPNDTIVASKPGGSLDRASRGKDDINLTVNGTLTLSSGNQKIDLMELVRNDPNSLRRLTEQILLEASRNKYGGRNEYNANRYTIS